MKLFPSIENKLIRIHEIIIFRKKFYCFHRWYLGYEKINLALCCLTRKAT